MPVTEVKISGERLTAANAALVEAMNRLNELGFTPDEVLTALLMTCGGALKRRGVSLNADLSVAKALPPLVFGYEQQPAPEPSRIVKPNGFIH